MGKDLEGKELGKGIRQKKDGRYEARLKVNNITINVTKKTLEECEAAFKIAVEKAEKNIDPRKEMTFNKWFETWFDTYKKPFVKASSVVPMKSAVKNTFCRKIGDMQLYDIKNIDIQTAINELIEEGRGVSVIRDALGRTKECLDSAKNNNMISVNPCYEIMIPWRKKKKTLRFFSAKEQSVFLNHVKEAGDWYYEMYAVMLLTGLRIGEIGGLMWKDIDFENKVINIERSLHCDYVEGVKTMMLTEPKTENSYRKIPFFGNIEEVLLQQKQKIDNQKASLGNRWRSTAEYSDLVFTTTMGSPVIRHTAQKQIKQRITEINEHETFKAMKENRQPIIFETASPHDFRHTFCSMCYKADMNPKYVQNLMGHCTCQQILDTKVKKLIIYGAGLHRPYATPDIAQRNAGQLMPTV